ncbi:DUF1800 domain-containing protein [Sphaerotilus sp.]|jgi:uncharacterized protein (DUF1800 family)|uniref:DUF1800 domain-containing protein n=1 Tax=Sphaerotilus sp. TaxID=2093942 RepID=UPI0025E1AB1F|nr:DUF1800 domain-containing protein [Sphaerotilus sp.]
MKSPQAVSPLPVTSLAQEVLRAGRWLALACVFTSAAQAQTPAQMSCPAKSLAWTTPLTGKSCAGVLAATPSGTSVTVRNTLSGVTGLATLKCESGVWTTPTSHDCTATAGTLTTSTTPTTPITSLTTSLTTTPPVFQAPVVDAAEVAAARLLEQATFGPTAAEIARARQISAATWIDGQLAMPATAIAAGGDSTDPVREAWFMAMGTAPDQLRQRMVFALSQILVVSAGKNASGRELSPWLQTLSKHAFGNYGALLREMTLNPAMGKYLGLGHSRAPAPNEDFAREVMQLFSIGLVELNLDGSPRLDANGKTIPTYDQARIGAFARALSGWGFANGFEDMSAPLVAREQYHDRGAKTLLNGVVLPAGQTAAQDFDAVMNNLMAHPNVAPFISLRLIRHFVTSNPSRAYVQRVATVFKQSGGNLAATLRAVLLDTEARSAPGADAGHLRDPLLHTLALVRALGGQVISGHNVFWDYYLMGERPADAPSVFSFYSPMAPLPGGSGLVGPEFQLYAGSQAVRRANFVLALLDGGLPGSLRIDLSPFLAVAGNPQTLMALVERTLLQGRLSASTRQTIGEAVFKTSDLKQRALTALYLTAITGDYVVQK